MRFQSTGVATTFKIILASAFLSACLSTNQMEPTSRGGDFQSNATSPSPISDLPRDAIVVSAHPLASETGLAVLEEGGTAADAALAALAVLNVVEPHASGLGGGGFALTHFPGHGTRVIDFRETAPANMDVATFMDPADSLHDARHAGGSAVAVPSAWAGWFQLHESYGRLPLADLLQPAIHLAKNGYPVSRTLASLIQERADLFMTDPDFGRLFLKDGFPPMEGDTLKNPQLGDLLEDLASAGLQAFPEVCGTAIAEAVQASGGWITEEDIATYKAIERDALIHNWKKWTLAGPPPPAGTLPVLEALAIVEPLNLEAMSEGTRLHMLAEALKKAMRDKGKRMADPAFFATPIDSLLDPDLNAEILKQIYPNAIHHSWAPLGTAPVWNGTPPKDHGNTTHLSIIDKDGAAVSLTQSINHFFGAGVVARGLLLNNQMDDFTFIPESLNFPVPGKRPRSNMAPMMVLQDEEVMLCIGTPGGSRITTAMTQILINVLELGQGIQEAIESPRMHPVGGTLVIEPRFDEASLEELESIGYRIYPMAPFDRYFGGAHGIERIDSPRSVDPKRFAGSDPRKGHGLKAAPRIRLQGGADPRRDGQVAKMDARP